MHTSVKNPIIHDPCAQHISHQQSHCGGTHLSDCFSFFLCTFLSFSPKPFLYSVFCFKAATLITLARDVSFAWRLSLKPGIGEYGERWFVLMMGGDEGEMTKGRKMISDRRRGGSVRRNGADEPQIMAQMKLIQPFTFQSIINCLSVHQEDFCMFEADPHVWANMLGVNLEY